MIAALTSIKNGLDPYLMPLDGPTRAYSAGQSIHYYYQYARNVGARNSRLLNGNWFQLFIETVGTLFLIHEANRLKIFKGRHWEILFFGSTLGLASLNGLAFVSKYFKRELPPLLERISRASWQHTPVIRGVTKLVFTIFEFHRRPREIALCFLGGYVCRTRWNQKTSETIKSGIDTTDHCISAVRFYVGSGFERAWIFALYAFKDFSKKGAQK